MIRMNAGKPDHDGTSQLSYFRKIFMTVKSHEQELERLRNLQHQAAMGDGVVTSMD